MKKMTMLCIAIAMIMMFGTSQAQTYSTVAWDAYASLPTASNVPYCPCDSIKCVPPSGVTGISWSPSLTQHGDTLVLPSGFSGNVTCSSSNGDKLLKLRPTTAPVQPTFATTDTICGIETKLLDLGNVNQYGFNHYSWTPGGATTQTITVSTPGIYSGTVTNACGTANRSIQIWKFNNSKPNLGPDITACAGTTVVLDPGDVYSNVVWYPSNTVAPTYSPTYSGGVVVTTTNISDGCVDRDTINITFLTPPSQSIDRVTIDLSNGNNMVTWETTLGNANSVKIYRETTTDTYVLVGMSPYIVGSFTDTTNSKSRSWSYKISIIDTCGNEGTKSPVAKSIHSWLTPVVGGGYNLQWTTYVNGSKSVIAYNIYRGNSLGELTYFNYVPSDQTSFTISTFVDSIYVVGADLGSKSTTTDALSNWVAKSDISGINDYCITDHVAITQKNDLITIISDVTIQEINVANLLGQTIMSEKKNTFIIPTQGVFLISVMTEKGKITKKIIVL